MSRVFLYTIILLSALLSGCVYEDEDRDWHRGREWREERHEEREERERNSTLQQQIEQPVYQLDTLYLV